MVEYTLQYCIYLFCLSDIWEMKGLWRTWMIYFVCRNCKFTQNMYLISTYMIGQEIDKESYLFYIFFALKNSKVCPKFKNS
jgi:hypothetical protein